MSHYDHGTFELSPPRRPKPRLIGTQGQFAILCLIAIGIGAVWGWMA